MNVQSAAVALIVGACLLHAVWTLMPSAVRRALANALLRLPLPAALARRLPKTARAAPGCSCDGCDRHLPPPRPVEPLIFHPRPRR